MGLELKSKNLHFNSSLMIPVQRNFTHSLGNPALMESLFQGTVRETYRHTYFLVFQWRWSELVDRLDKNQIHNQSQFYHYILSSNCPSRTYSMIISPWGNISLLIDLASVKQNLNISGIDFINSNILEQPPIKKIFTLNSERMVAQIAFKGGRGE